jgi:ABC-type molybdate transport system substrate-binding protein
MQVLLTHADSCKCCSSRELGDLIEKVDPCTTFLSARAAQRKQQEADDYADKVLLQLETYSTVKAALNRPKHISKEPVPSTYKDAAKNAVAAVFAACNHCEAGTYR